MAEKLNICSDARLHHIAGQATPGNSVLWNRVQKKPDAFTARQLSKAGVTAISVHPECKAAELYAKTRGVPAHQAFDKAVADTKKFAKKNRLGFVQFGKGDLCENCDNATTTIYRPGTESIKTKGFRINGRTTTNVPEANAVLHSVGVSRGADKRNVLLVSPDAADAERHAKKIGRKVPGVPVHTVIAPRRS